MMLRRAAALLIALAALLALYELVVVPWRCNEVEGIVSRATRIVNTDDPRIRAAAERNLEQLEPCRRKCPTDVNLKMVAAANLVTLGRYEAAAALYQEALRYDERPEVFLALAMMQADTGQRDAALANAIRGADFVGVEPLAGISDPIVRWRAYETVGRNRERFLARAGAAPQPNILTNSTFDVVGESGPVVHVTGPNHLPSAARAWYLFNAAGPAQTSLVPSTRRSGGKAVHVTTTSAGAGLLQSLPDAKWLPRVRTSAWVFVKRGRVAIGSGNALPMSNAVSTTTGRWERLEAINESCPAKMTQVFAASDDGAEFLVDEVTVQATLAAPPCEN